MGKSAAPVRCRNVWKIYGPREREVLTAMRDASEAAPLSKDEVRERFGCVVGVQNVSFEVEPGETFCIMGLSGSGKSTLLRHVNRLIEPSSGAVEIKGRDISALGARELERLRAESIGMVFQHMALWPHRTIRENVAFGLEVRGVGRRARAAAADRALELVQLSGWESRYPDELSGGMQQRVGLARALAADPDILLMDEPFSALDPLIRRDLQAQFSELARTMNKTVLFITHDLEEAIQVGHRVAIMNEGAFVQVGRPEEILTRPATDYVARFVRGVSHLHFLTASAVMRPCDGQRDARRDSQTDGPPVDRASESSEARRDGGVGPDTPLSELLDRMAGGAPVMVRDGDRTIGRIGVEDLLAAIRARIG
jgi:glycine betaine/proline transport system ATP-binding protein